MPEKCPHMKNLSTFVQNRSNLACTPQMSTPRARSFLALSELVVKLTSLKRGSQTSPEGSVSEHLNFLTIKTTPQVFYTLTRPEQQRMHNYIHFLQHLHILFFFS